MRLNLGSDKKKIEGFHNVDIDPRCKPDFVAPINKLDFADDGTIDEIACYHAIEHIYRWELMDCLREWYRVLKVGGKVAIECPDLDKCILNYIRYPQHPQFSVQGIFGDQRPKNPWYTHHWCYSVPELARALKEAGYRNIREEVATTHVPMRDLRIVAEK